MFLPMSCTSPFTVAMSTRPAALLSTVFAASMYGIRCATAFFITRALFTTCGRKSLPAPNRSPTTFMPRISGPSITSMGCVARSRASSVSSTTNASMPRTSACERRSSTGSARQARSSLTLAARPFAVSATSSSRSVASARRASTTSSTRSRRSAGMSS